MPSPEGAPPPLRPPTLPPSPHRPPCDSPRVPAASLALREACDLSKTACREVRRAGDEGLQVRWRRGGRAALETTGVTIDSLTCSCATMAGPETLKQAHAARPAAAAGPPLQVGLLEQAALHIMHVLHFMHVQEISGRQREVSGMNPPPRAEISRPPCAACCAAPPPTPRSCTAEPATLRLGHPFCLRT